MHHLDGDVESGALLAICGPNGAGKSTLLKAITGSLAPLSGSVALPRVKAREIAYLPQASDIDKSFPIRSLMSSPWGLWSRCGLFGAIAKRELAKIGNAIAAVGLEGFEDRAIGTLSGGQLQRMLFARLLASGCRRQSCSTSRSPQSISKTTADLLLLVARWRSEKRTVLAVLHDMDLVREHFPQTLLLAREKSHGETHATSSLRKIC